MWIVIDGSDPHTDSSTPHPPPKKMKIERFADSPSFYLGKSDAVHLPFLSSSSASDMRTRIGKNFLFFSSLFFHA